MSKYKTTGIPFAIRNSDGAEVDVADVDRGLDCGCICPSCKAPLIARKGDIKEWHFAHASKDAHKRDVTDCEFSFFVSVRMMSKKILSMAGHIELPEGLVYAALNGQYQGKKYFYSLPYANKSTFKPDSIQVETTWDGMHVDALMAQGKYQIAIFFRCPDKRPAYNYPAKRPDDTGVLEIDLTDCRELLYGHDRPKDVTFTTLLERFLKDRVDNKQWLFHPRKAKRQEAVDRLLKENIYEKISESSSFFTAPKFDQYAGVDSVTMHEGVYKFHCAICHSNWKGEYVSGRYCPKCQSHLYVTENGKA